VRRQPVVEQLEYKLLEHPSQILKPQGRLL